MLGWAARSAARWHPTHLPSPAVAAHELQFLGAAFPAGCRRRVPPPTHCCRLHANAACFSSFPPARRRLPPQNETYVLASEAQVILPSEAEAAVFEEAHSAGENAEQHTNWLGCFVAAETLMDGEVVSSLSGLVSPEECCRECRADAACNVWSFCERPEGCR